MGVSHFNECVECDEIITNPICAECLSSRMRIMIQEVEPSLAQEIHGFEVEGDTNCIFCGKRMGLCAHCFSKDIYFYIKDKNPYLAQEFMNRFDFDLREKQIIL